LQEIRIYGRRKIEDITKTLIKTLIFYIIGLIEVKLRLIFNTEIRVKSLERLTIVQTISSISFRKMN